MNKFKEISREIALLLTIPITKSLYLVLNNPGNGASSLVSFILIMAINSSKIKNKLNVCIITGISVSIILSTFFIKQHVILDAIAAIILGRTVFNIVYKAKTERIVLWFRKQFSLLTMKRKLGI